MRNKIIIVEGKNDYNKLKSINNDFNILITNGSCVSKEFLSMLKKLEDTNDFILFLDPDSPGERIRKIIKENISNTYDCFIKKDLAISSNFKKVGVEHASNQDIIEALKNINFSNQKGNLTIIDLIKLDLIDNKKKRLYIANKLNIGNPNNKTFLNRLNNYNISYDKLLEILDEYRSNS